MKGDNAGRFNRTPGAPLRASAARVLHAVTGQGKSLDDALAFAEARNRFDARDSALLAAIVYGTLRNWRRLGVQAEAMMTRPLHEAPMVDALLRAGLFQMLDMRVPDHAVVSATAGAAQLLDAEWAAPLINALLRRAQREPEGLIVPEDAAVQHSWPDWLAARLRADWGEAAEALMASGNAQAPMTLRVNRRRMAASDYRARLQRTGQEARLLEGVPEALVLEQACEVEALPGFARGSVSVQDASAQLAAGLLDVHPGQRVLDACSAPGGKAAHILERCPDAELVALDSDRRRIRTVDATLQRIGLKATLAAADATDTARWWEGEPFDRILIDAPCSGTGVARRHPDIKWLRRESDITALAATQRALLDALWPLLAPGGRLVFATCSLLRAEGADVVGAFAEAHPVLDATPDLPVGEREPVGWRIPAGGDWDGFYYAVLERAAT